MNSQAKDESIIELTNVSKTFSNMRVLSDINLKFKKGNFTCILGSSGCGKSTLLRLLNGLEKIDEGEIVIDQLVLKNDRLIGKKIYNEITQKVRKKVGMVFQSFQLFPHLTLLENIARPLMVVKKTSKEEARVIAFNFLDKVGLKHHSEKYPHQLSGGEQQRAAIARALALKPIIMLYDEPTSALDPGLVGEVHQVMKDIDQETMTQIIVTHEMRFARDVADIIIFMDKGKIIEINNAQSFFSDPKHELSRNFLRNFS